MDGLTPPPSADGDGPNQEGPCTNTQCAHARGILVGLNDTLRAEKAEAEREADNLRREITQLRRLRAGPTKHTQVVCNSKVNLDTGKVLTSPRPGQKCYANALQSESRIGKQYGKNATRRRT